MSVKCLIVAAILIGATLPTQTHAAPVDAYGALPAVDNVSVSPSGTRVAMILNRGDQRVFVVRELEGSKKVLQSVGVNRNKLRGVRWADDDHLFVSLSQTEGVYSGEYAYEQGLQFLVNLKTGKNIQLEPSDDYTVRGLPLRITHEKGRTYGYFNATLRDPSVDSRMTGPNSRSAINRLDLDSFQEVTVVSGRDFDAEYALTKDGKLLARLESLEHGTQWRIRNEGTGAVLAHGGAEVGGAGLEGLGRTVDSILFSNTEDGDFASIRELNLATGKLSAPLVEGADARAIHNPKTGLLAGFELGGDTDEVALLDPQLDARWRSVQAAFKGARVSLSSFDDAMNRWVVFVEGPHDSGHYYLVDLTEKRALPLGAAYPEIKAEDVGDFGWFDYAAADGTKLKAVLTLPPGYTRQTAKNLPVIVMPHGGPAAYDYPRFDWWSQALASRGYAVLQPNFRGSTGFGAKFERAGWGQWGKLMQTDVSDGLKALAAQGVVDAKRACIVGWSYGGYAALAGITVQNGVYRCSAAGGAVSDLNAMLTWERVRQGKQSSTVRYWKKSMALNGEGDPSGAAVSPLKLAGKADAPLLLLHGRDDTVVPITQAKAMQTQLQQARKPVEFVELNGEDHWLSTAKTRTEMLKAMTGFLARYNPPASLPPASTASKGQSQAGGVN